MTFTIDLDTLTLVRAPQDTRSATTPEAKRGDATPFEVTFIRAGAVVELDADAVLTFGCKPKGKYDGAAVVLQAGFVKSGSGETTKYSASPSFNTEGLDALFQVDGDDSNDVADVTLMAEFTWRVDEEEPTSTRTFDFKVSNDVLRGDETTPAVFPDPSQWMPAALILEEAPVDGSFAVGIAYMISGGPTVGTTLEIGDITYEWVSSASEAYQIEESGDTATDATRLLAAINGTDGRSDPHPNFHAPGLSSGDGVYIYSRTQGSAANGATFTTNEPTRIDVSSSPIEGGIDGTLAACVGQLAVVGEVDTFICVRLSAVKWLGLVNS